MDKKHIIRFRLFHTTDRFKEHNVLIFPDSPSDFNNKNIRLVFFGGAFNFLRDEPDLYSRKDLKKAY